MSDFVPPLRDIRFVLDEVAGLKAVAALPGFEEATPDLVDSILEEAAKIAAETLAPLNRVGDVQGAKLTETGVRTAEGWIPAWNTLVEGGWNGLPASADHGGMGLPNLLNIAVHDMWQAANMAFTLCPMLTQGAVNALELYGSDALKQLFLPKLVTGEWTGTMNLTEPAAGSDLGAIRTRAVPAGEHYRISGQKIFITYGDHDLAENIIHLVLGRTPDAPAGVKGISLFIVPKVLVDDNGEMVGPNDVQCVSLEHKLGIHGSPTAVLSFGDNEGAIGYLVGEVNRGLEYMFAMMNHARLAVGLQGLAIAERAYQQARSYARDRVQGKPVGWQGSGPTAIIHHPDVRRMLMTMKCRIEAMRGLIYTTAAAADIAHSHPDAAERARAARTVELLTPIAKGWSTETGCDIASLGVQIHGGMGYVEETGAAQHFRDARITTIYEGTTAIQANDLVNRKVLRDGGIGVRLLLGEIADLAEELAGSDDASLARIGRNLHDGAKLAGDCVTWMLDSVDPRQPAAAAVPFLTLMGIVVGGQQMALAARAAQRKLDGDADGFHGAKLTTARFYAEHILPQASGLHTTILSGSDTVMALDEAVL
jgi:3-(methylthio)propanoyl-CoA dehydrogenase